MKFSHTTQIIYQSIISVLHFSTSFDNASNNIKLNDYFTRSLNPIMDGEMFHQKCACHILHLTVKTGIKTQCVNALIVKFKNRLHHIYFI
jgi:hypothetical protein